VFRIGIWGALELCLGVLSSQKPPPWRRDCSYHLFHCATFTV